MAISTCPRHPTLTQLSPVDPEDDDRRFVFAFASTLILLVVVNAYGATVMTGVLEEKTTRVVELVLAAVPARWLLAGKLIGLGLLGLAQLAVIALVGGAALAVTSDVEVPSGFVGLIVASVVWFVLGYAFYATGYAAAGASVTRTEDAQAALTPVSTLVMGAYLSVALVVLPDPGGTASRWLSQLPPVAPLAVPARIALDEIAVWEIASATVLTLAAVAGIVMLGGRLYAGSVLRTGGRVGWREAWRTAEL